MSFKRSLEEMHSGYIASKNELNEKEKELNEKQKILKKRREYLEEAKKQFSFSYKKYVDAVKVMKQHVEDERKRPFFNEEGVHDMCLPQDDPELLVFDAELKLDEAKKELAIQMQEFKKLMGK